MLALSLLASPVRHARAAEPYRLSGDCDGFPATGLRGPPGSCVGLVARGLGTPRGVAVIGSDIYLVDTGENDNNRGRLLRLGHLGHDAPMVLSSGLDAPTALGFDPGGRLFVAVRGGIDRIDLAGGQVQLVPVLVGLPDDRHQPLTAFTFRPDGRLFVNVGARTASCEGPGRTLPQTTAACRDITGHPPRAAIIAMRLEDGAPVDARAAPVLARGLRNSAGLAVLPDNRLVATVNVRDFVSTASAAGPPDEDEPHDTLDIIRPGAEYGWPGCFDDRRQSPDYPGADCHAIQPPTFLLPGHASPLSLLLYQGNTIPSLHQTLLIPFHGYRRNGHRLMAMALTGKTGLSGVLSPVIGDWDNKPGERPQGNPTALAEMADGSVLITEDHNGDLLRLAQTRTR